MSFLNVGSVKQFVVTAACDFFLKKGSFKEVKEGPLLCSVLAPAVQAAGNYVYQNAISAFPDVPYSSEPSGSLKPLEYGAAGTLGAYAGYRALKSGADAWSDIFWPSPRYYRLAFAASYARDSSLMRAGMAVIGTQLTTHLADVVKKTYFSQDSSSTAEKAPKVETTA